MTSEEDREHAVEDSLVGTWIIDQFHIVRVIAQGGMGQVYLAEQASMDRFAAIKILSSERARAGGDELRKRFRQEARAISRLTHPNIVTVYNFGELSEGSLFLAMEYVEGMTLARALAQGPVSIEDTLEIARQCASALDYAHQKHVVHRDFKPDNVMLSDLSGARMVKVVDFGIARLLEQNDLTQPGDLIGTPKYISPEQCRGELATAQTDQYALGLVVYELLTGEAAFQANSTLGYLHLHQHVMPSPPSTIRQERGVAMLDRLVLRMLNKVPSERFSSMKEVIEAFDEVGYRLHRGGGRKPSMPLPTRDESTQQTQAGSTLRIRPIPERDKQPVSEQSTRTPLTIASDLPLDASLEVTLTEFGFRVARQTGHENQVNASDSKARQFHLCAFREPRVEHDAIPTYVSDPAKTLLSIEPTVEFQRLSRVVEEAHNVIVSKRPLSGDALSGALMWMREPDSGIIEQLFPTQTIQVMQVSSASSKSSYVDSLLEDASALGIRRRSLQALAELAEEMIMNAIFHAPVNLDGTPRFSHLDRTTDVKLRGGEECTLKWTVTDRFIALSIRDPFGSLKAKDIVRKIFSREGVPAIDEQSVGGGMGLHIMSQAARHLFFGICPGSWCEVLALVERESNESRYGGEKSVVILHHLGKGTVRIGDRLRLTERRVKEDVFLALEGEINETADVSTIFDRHGRVYVDLSGVTRINSVGLSNWLKAASKKPSDETLFFEKCSIAVVRQLNMIPTFAETGNVVSMFVPYYCPRCRSETMELISTEEVVSHALPSFDCAPECQRAIDGDATEFFAFLRDK